MHFLIPPALLRYGYLFFTGLNTQLDRKQSALAVAAPPVTTKLARGVSGSELGLKRMGSNILSMKSGLTPDLRLTRGTGQKSVMATMRGMLSWVDVIEIRMEGYAQFVRPLLVIKKGIEDITSKSLAKMTWKSHFLRFAKEAAYGILYLHGSRYWDEDGKAWRDCIIHRDLKPENMLISKDWVLKLTDFGEARATDKQNMTMTTVGTPIYMAPEILREDRYDIKADVYSYAIVLVAMLRGEKSIIDYFFEHLRCKMHRPNKNGLGLNLLNNRITNKQWRPKLPTGTYPSLKKLIEDCWQDDSNSRPTFDEIVRVLETSLSDEVKERAEIVIKPPSSQYGAGADVAAEEGNGGGAEDEALKETVRMNTERLSSMASKCRRLEDEKAALLAEIEALRGGGVGGAGFEEEEGFEPLMMEPILIAEEASERED